MEEHSLACAFPATIIDLRPRQIAMPAQHAVPTLPDLREIIRRFNAACGAFDDAIAAAHARDGEQHDAGLLQSAREMGSALELAVWRCVGLARPELLSDRQERDFPSLIEQLRALGAPPLGDGQAQRLRQWRGIRNRAEHAPIRVPALRELLEALRGTRRFIGQAFGEIEDLTDPDRVAATVAPSPAGPPMSAMPMPLDDAHRQEDPEGWVRGRLHEGRQRLSGGRSERPPLHEAEVRQSLTRAAWALAEAGSAPDDPIPGEALRPVIDAHRRLYFEAGWLVEGDAGLRFRDPRLPALLTGLELARRGSSVSGMRRALGCRRRWAEAAWAATSAGDLAFDWLRPLLDDGEIEHLPDRVVTSCAALAGLRAPHDRATVDLAERSATVVGAALVWFASPPDPERARGIEAWDAWQLDRIEWRRAVLDLASGTRTLSMATGPIDWERPGGALGRLLAALDLPTRLSDDAAKAVLLLACPWAREGVSHLDERFFRLLFSIDGGLAGRVDSQFTSTWLAQIGIQALRQGDPRRAERMLVIPAAGHPAGFLLNSPELRPDWCQAWDRLAGFESAEEAARAWVLGVTWVARSGKLDDGVADFLLRHAPDRLRILGTWETARSMLEDALSPIMSPTKPDEQQLRFGSTLFALAELTSEAWRQKIASWSEGPHLPWRILLEAGAPPDAVARWCVEKLQQKERDAPRQDGPVGIIASPGVEILHADGWQVAFREAREALEWLLDNGDERAVAVLADACFADEEAQRCEPILGKFVGLDVPLSQALWGRVLARRDGRAALYARVERGLRPGGDLHFLSGGKPSFTDGLWDALALHLSLPLLRDSRAPSEEEVAEARRLLSAFERWMAAQSPGVWRHKPERSLWADPAMRGTKTLMVSCGVVHGLDVAEQLYILLCCVIEDARVEETELLVVLGDALDRLCRRAGEPSEALLALAATPQVAARLAHDQARAFWMALLRQQGTDAVARLLDALALPDAGLGLFDALASVAPEVLTRWQERPDLLRPVLVRSAQGRFQPSPAFHEQAWARPRRPEEIRDLEQIHRGEWLGRLLEQSRRWPSAERDALLRWLAQRSRCADVRRACLEALLENL